VVLSNPLGQILNELAGAVISAFEGLLAQMGDWFGLLTSGVPQGYAADAFYWSDIFHYRRTYQFPYELYRQARGARDQAVTDVDREDAEARMAFAVGWMSHCATDVVGHPFTNAKCGGPYRDHWQRHHLIENHMDSQCYSANHGGTQYGEYGVSALHFWAAFRGGGGREDMPAYDYFAGLPAYDTSDTPTGAARRRVFFDLDSGPLPDHLIDGLLDAMAAVHPDGPRILAQDPGFSATVGAGTPDGRPNRAAMDEMWTIVYSFLKMSGSDGLSPSRPQPPGVFTDHSFPTPPGGDYGVDDDPARGADVDNDDSFTLLDLILALFAWIVYIFQVVEWLVTVLPGLILDVATFPAREVIHWTVVVPLWNLYLLGRRALVMAGFLVPGPDEIDLGLTTLGTASGTFNIGALLDDPTATTLTAALATEPSGRASSASEFGLDSLYPRNIVRDRPADIAPVDLAGILGLTGRLQYAGDGAEELKPSEWIAPWRYPLTNQAGATVPQEGAPVHVGLTSSVTMRRRSCPVVPATRAPATRSRTARHLRRHRRRSGCCCHKTGIWAAPSTTAHTWQAGWPPRRVRATSSFRYRTSTWTPTVAMRGGAGTGIATTRGRRSRETRVGCGCGNAFPRSTSTQRSRIRRGCSSTVSPVRHRSSSTRTRTTRGASTGPATRSTASGMTRRRTSVSTTSTVISRRSQTPTAMIPAMESTTVRNGGEPNGWTGCPHGGGTST
jgi:hypothetical protein